jgi:hypothetical protein
MMQAIRFGNIFKFTQNQSNTWVQAEYLKTTIESQGIPAYRYYPAQGGQVVVSGQDYFNYLSDLAKAKHADKKIEAENRGRQPPPTRSE